MNVSTFKELVQETNLRPGDPCIVRVANKQGRTNGKYDPSKNQYFEEKCKFIEQGPSRVKVLVRNKYEQWVRAENVRAI